MRIKDYEQASNIRDDDVLIIDGANGTKTISPRQVYPYSYESEAFANGTMDGVEVPPQHRAYHNNAKYHAENAALSATNAATSETNAATSETNAAASETNAAASATAASASESAAAASESNAATSETNAAASETAAATSEANAAASATTANQNALKAEGYAVGEQNGVPVDPSSPYYNDSAKHWADIARSAAVGGLVPKGTCTFENLPTTASSRVGDMWNISNGFVTTSDFVEGAGHKHSAGANVYMTSDHLWDVYEGESASDAMPMIAEVETSPATRAHAKDSQFIYDDVLYTATKAIAIGDDIIPGEPEPPVIGSLSFENDPDNPSNITRVEVDDVYYTIEDTIPITAESSIILVHNDEYEWRYPAAGGGSNTETGEICSFNVPSGASGNAVLHLHSQESGSTGNTYDWLDITDSTGWVQNINPTFGQLPAVPVMPTASPNCIKSETLVEQIASKGTNDNFIGTRQEWDALTLEQQAQYKTMDFLGDVGAGSGGGGSGSTNYSTEEKIVGTWIDGKPLYQKTILSSTALVNNSTIDLSSLDTEHVIVKEFVGRSGIIFTPMINSFYADIQAWGSTYFYNLSNQTITIACGNAGFAENRANDGYILTIQYTKTTD